MKPEEAIENLKLMQAQVEWEYPMNYAAAIDAAIEALEKQIPAKMNKVDMVWVCRCCGKPPGRGGYSGNFRYCEWCGQRLG